MRDDQVRRYARHLALAEVGRTGQAALLAASATLPVHDAADVVCASYLAAGGVGTVVAPGASDAQRADIAAHGPDTRVLADGAGEPVAAAPVPAWWPGAAGDDTALAFWRGAIAATRWMARTAIR